MGEIPSLVFLGYRIKRPWDPGPDWAPIERVCCVGDSLCKPPEGWIDRWDFNRAFCYATPEAAWSTLEGDRAAYRLFAYFLLPLDLYDGEAPEVAPLGDVFSDSFSDLPGPPFEPLDMVPLGYDVAECKDDLLGLPYSPLVNNGFSHDFRTNRYGLLDDLATAMRACEVINDEMPEHAPHWVFQVFASDIDAPLPPEPAEG